MAFTLTGLAVGHEAVPRWTETPVASWRVHTLVLTGIPHLTLIDVCWCRIIQRKLESINSVLNFLRLWLPSLLQKNKKETIPRLTLFSLISTAPRLHSYQSRSLP